QPGVFHHLLDWLLVNLRRQFGQSAIQISRLMARAVAVNDPPLDLELRRLFDIERRVTALTNGLIKLDEMGQSFLVIRALLAFFENEGGSGGLIGYGVRSGERQVGLRSHQLGQFREDVNATLSP